MAEVENIKESSQREKREDKKKEEEGKEMREGRCRAYVRNRPCAQSACP